MLNLENIQEENLDYVAFVDIDGVFNNEYSTGTYSFLKESVEIINYLYEKYNIKLILSSSWRHAYTFTFMQKLFKENGIKAPLIDKTYVCFPEVEKRSGPIKLADLMIPDDYELCKNNLYLRDNEILEWVKIFKPTHYVIIDDFKMRHPDLLKHQIITDNYGNDEKKLGLRKFHISQIEEILKL